MLPNCLCYMEIRTQDNQPSTHNIHCHIGVHHQSQSCNIHFKHWIMYVHGSQSESMYIHGKVDICKGGQLPAVMILPQTMLMSIIIKGFYRNTRLCKHQPCNMLIKLRYDLKLWKYIFNVILKDSKVTRAPMWTFPDIVNGALTPPMAYFG